MPKVMLIEDDITMLSLLRTLLELEGYEVIDWGNRESHDNLADVLSKIQREQPALVMVDVNLRGLNGIDLLRRIRNERTLAGMRVLMSSGMDFTQECRQEGADGFMLKPFMPDELIDRIQEILERKE